MLEVRSRLFPIWISRDSKFRFKRKYVHQLPAKSWFCLIFVLSVQIIAIKIKIH